MAGTVNAPRSVRRRCYYPDTMSHAARKLLQFRNDARALEAAGFHALAADARACLQWMAAEIIAGVR